MSATDLTRVVGALAVTAITSVGCQEDDETTRMTRRDTGLPTGPSVQYAPRARWFRNTLNGPIGSSGAQWDKESTPASGPESDNRRPLDVVIMTESTRTRRPGPSVISRPVAIAGLARRKVSVADPAVMAAT